MSDPQEVADLEIGPPQARRATSCSEIALHEAAATSRAPELSGTRRTPPEALNRPFCVDWGGRSRVKSKFQDRPPGAATASEHKKRHGALRGRSSLFSALRHAGHLGCGEALRRLECNYRTDQRGPIAKLCKLGFGCCRFRESVHFAPTSLHRQPALLAFLRMKPLYPKRLLKFCCNLRGLTCTVS